MKKTMKITPTLNHPKRKLIQKLVNQVTIQKAKTFQKKLLNKAQETMTTAATRVQTKMICDLWISMILRIGIEVTRKNLLQNLLRKEQQMMSTKRMISFEIDLTKYVDELFIHSNLVY